MEVADKKGFWALSRLVTASFPIRATFFQNFQNRAKQSGGCRRRKDPNGHIMAGTSHNHGDMPNGVVKKRSMVILKKPYPDGVKNSSQQHPGKAVNRDESHENHGGNPSQKQITQARHVIDSMFRKHLGTEPNCR